MSRLDHALRQWLLPLGCLCLMGGIALGYRMAVWWPAPAALVLCIPAALLHRGARRSCLALLAAFCAGSMLGYTAEHPALPPEGDYQVSGVVCEAVQHRDNGQVVTTLRHLTLNGKPFGDGAYWSFYTETLPQGLAPGAHVAFTARLYHPSGADNPGGYDLRRSLLQRGVTIGLYSSGAKSIVCDRGVWCLWGAVADVRHRIAQGLTAMMGEDAGAYASAMLLGERTLLPDEDQRAFRRLGIAHVLSVSGYHVGVLAALLMGLMNLLRLPRKGREWPIGAVLAAYCLLTGMHAPTIRASLLVMFGLFGRRIGAVPARLHWLSAAAALQLLVSPIQLTSASFQLTYGALLGITLVTTFLQQRFPVRSKLGGMLSVAWVTLGAQLGVLLPELYWFHELPALGLLSNLILLSIVSLLMTLYWLCLPAMLIPGISSLLGTAASWATGAFSAVIRILSDRFGLMLWTRQANGLTVLGWVLVLACTNRLWRRWGRKQAAAAALGLVLIVLSVLPWPTQGAGYIQFSVGEADAALLWDDDRTVVIDAGTGADLARYLHAHRLSVDTLILTHLHSDHAAGVAALLTYDIPIGRCCLPADAKLLSADDDVTLLLEQLRARGVPIEALSRGDVLPLPHGQLTVLWPEAGHVRPGSSANAYSLTLAARVYGVTLLLTGDLDGAYEQYAAVPADVLKAAHHGSASSTGEAFLQAVQPSVVLQSCGKDARVEGLRSRLGDLPLYATHECGAVTLRIDADGCTVIPFHSP